MYLAIDIGGTYIKYGYYHQDGQCEYQDKIKTIKSDINAFYDSLLLLKKEHIKGVAISMPGLIDSQSGYVYAITLLPFLTNHNVKEELEELFKLPVTIENDAKCATLGEMWKGNLQNVNNGLLIVFGSGIGGTLIIDGKIVNSPHHKAGEIGSILMPLDLHYQHMTNFGRHNNANAIIHSIAEEMNCEESGDKVFHLIQTNQQAKKIFEQYCLEVAFMIYNLDYILDLDVVCIGGGISEQKIFIQTIQEQFKKLRMSYKEDEHEPNITSCLYHNNANLLGALYHHMNK